MAVKSKPLQATVVAVTAQMIAPLVTMTALASARVGSAAVVVSAAVVATVALVVIAAAASTVAKVVARVAKAARHPPAMVVLPKLAKATIADQFVV